MKNQNKAFTATLITLAFAFVTAVQGGPHIDGGPTPFGRRVNANTEGSAQSGMPNIPLPIVSVEFAPVGVTLDQTARVNLINMDVANGITVSCQFIDANGAILAESSTTLTIGKIYSVDFKSDPAPGDSPQQLRAEVRVQVDIHTPGVSSASLRRSLEVFNNNSGETAVFMGSGS